MSLLVGSSVPRVECWGTPQQRRAWEAQDVGTVDSHEGTLYDVFARASAFSQACERNANENDILSHLSTASHARDMLEILDQLGEDKLNFWGFSYGTILGGTFAAMYPDRVGRLASDGKYRPLTRGTSLREGTDGPAGNVDYLEWHSGTHINFLRDTDKVMDAFYSMCHQAGATKCAFYEDTTEQIKDRLEALLNSLRIRPVIALTTDTDGHNLPEVITYSKVRKLISAALYRPIQKFGPLADALAALEKADGLKYHDIVNPGTHALPDACTQNPIPPTTPLDTLVDGTGDAFPAIMCSDAEPLTETAVEFEEYSNALQEMSTAAGAVNVLFRISCAGRTTRPKWRFNGPFTGNTSSPILFIANVADNVTPLVSARNNSQGFDGSVVLIQNSLGVSVALFSLSTLALDLLLSQYTYGADFPSSQHTSLAAPSTCTALHIRAYFQDGVVPPPGTECEPDKLPFDLTPPSGGMKFDDRITPAIRALSERSTAIAAR